MLSSTEGETEGVQWQEGIHGLRRVGKVKVVSLAFIFPSTGPILHIFLSETIKQGAQVVLCG